MKKILIAIVLVVVALTLAAQPVLASQSPMFHQEAPVVNQSSYDGEDKFENTWYGFKLYLSRGTLLWIGAGVSAGGLSAFLINLALAPLLPVVSAIGFVLIALGIPFFLSNSAYDYGIILTFWTGGLPAPLLIGVSPQPAPPPPPPSGGGGGRVPFYPTGNSHEA